ncbi:mCG147847 [Mus musculus]|nr:mCG147847 [Mus musculus]
MSTHTQIKKAKKKKKPHKKSWGLLYWPTTPGHGICPRVSLIYTVKLHKRIQISLCQSVPVVNIFLVGAGCLFVHFSVLVLIVLTDWGHFILSPF